MNDVIKQMLSKYDRVSVGDDINALREILQEVALLGLWRSRFFEKAAFYGGTALRILYGLDRFSEDLDFSLLESNSEFNLEKYRQSIEAEINGFGFNVKFERKVKSIETAMESAFIKADTMEQLIIIESDRDFMAGIHPKQKIKIKIEVDTNPPLGFETEAKYLLQPIPFSVRTYSLPDLFAGKMHALLCRKWKNRVKGRDWYDYVWYCTNYPQLHLSHLEERMRQSKHWVSERLFTSHDLMQHFDAVADTLDIEQARREMEPFIRNAEVLDIWSIDFFRDIFKRIEFV